MIYRIFIWGHTDLRGLDSKARIAAIEIKLRSVSRSASSFCFWYFYRLPRSTTAHYHVAEAGPERLFPKRLITDNVYLCDFRRDAFLKDER